MVKKCSKCGEVKDASEYGKDKIVKSGLRSSCKECRSIETAVYKKKTRSTYAYYYSKTPKGKYHRLKNNVRTRKVKVILTQAEFIEWWVMQPRVCHYCGQELTQERGHQLQPSNLTIDRMDNSIGYAVGNLVLACRRCNLAKGQWFTEQQMLEIAHKYFAKVGNG